MAWRVRLRYIPRPAPTLVELLDLARAVERALRGLGHTVDPRTVLIRTDGIAIAVTAEGDELAQAVRAARQMVARAAERAGVDEAWLGPVREVKTEPGGARPAVRPPISGRGAAQREGGSGSW